METVSKQSILICQVLTSKIKKKIKQGKEISLVAVAAILNGVAMEDLSEGN